MYLRRQTRKILLRNMALFALLIFMFWGGFVNDWRNPDSTFNLEAFKHRMKGPLSPVDKYLLEEVAKSFLIPPSSKPYDMQFMKRGEKAITYTKKYQSIGFWKFLNEEIRVLYPKDTAPKDGFFIEAGAFDGEFMSNSLYLEFELGWTGLLIEPDQELFQALLQKNRKAWACHCCLSIQPYPHQTVLTKMTTISNDISDPLYTRLYNSVSESFTHEDRAKLGFSVYENVQCFPLQTMLLALNRTHVDFISLDIEDIEVGFLSNFAWDLINVDIWIIEHRNSSLKLGQDAVDYDFVKWFEAKGHVLYKIAPYFIDYIFIKNNSDYFTNNRDRLSL